MRDSKLIDFLIRSAWLTAITLGLCGCVAAPGLPDRPQSNSAYFDDARFVTSRFEPADSRVTVLTPEMQQFVDQVLRRRARSLGPVQALVSALNDPASFGFVYDAELTLTASETFASRSGNCLSLALMTAALAEALGLEVEFQTALLPEAQAQFRPCCVLPAHDRRRPVRNQVTSPCASSP